MKDEKKEAGNRLLLWPCMGWGSRVGSLELLA
jgi:hypothetical protein